MSGTERPDWPNDLARREAEASDGPTVVALDAAAPVSGPRRFNARVAYHAKTPEQRRFLAEVAILLAYARAAADRVDGPAAVGFEAAEQAALAAVDTALDGIALLDPPPLPDLSLFGVRACRVCGCTEACACPEGCSWVAEDLCSSCARRGVGVRPW